MGKMNQKFMEEFGSGFTKDIEDFLDDDYHYEKWLEELGEINEKKVEEQVTDVLKTVHDPEIPVNIYELGLIYFVKVKKSLSGEGFFVNVIMTVTSPNCPAIESLPEEITYKVEKLDSVIKCDVEVTFDPPWDRSFMSEEAKLELGFL